MGPDEPMTEEEYLELKKFHARGLLLADEMRKDLPEISRVYFPSFSTVEELKLTDDEIEEWEKDFEILRKIMLIEEDNRFAADLIWVYEIGKGIK